MQNGLEGNGVAPAADRRETGTEPPVETTGFDILLNGETMRVEGLSPNTTLLDWLRATGRTGAKQGCAEGDCGACTVALAECDAAGRPTWRAVNSCIALLPMIAGREVRTVEGIGKAEGGRRKAEGLNPAGNVLFGTPNLLPSASCLHPSQRAMVAHHGSQCGYCTPGFVMSLFEGTARTDLRERWQVADQLSGNLCRCTGYRPIADAAAEVFANVGTRCPETPLPEAPATPPLAYGTAHGERFLRPERLDELLALRARYPEARLIAGATELGIEVTKKFHRFVTLISVEGVAELGVISRSPDAWTFGAAATLTRIEEAMRGDGDGKPGPEATTILKMIRVWGSRPIRNRATIGGNLANASPIGDLAPVLLALDARLRLVSAADGEREVPLAEFFLAYRQTALRRDEILRAIVVPTPPPGSGRRLVDCFKVSKRREMDISIVAGAFRVELDAAGNVADARLAYGGVAATTLRARKTEAALLGQPWTCDTLDAVLPVLAAEFSPISDVRASADYRRGLITALFEKFFNLDGNPEPETLPDRRPVVAPEQPFQYARQHESAVGHVTGRARYVDDTAPRRGTLEVWPVCAPHARARILHRDADAARRMPGVHAVLLAEDVPGLNDVGAVRHDEVLLADTDVFFRGQLIAMVVGETAEQCRLAAAEVVVTYEPLPPVLTIPEALAADSFHTDPHTIRRGDPEAWFASRLASGHPASRVLSGSLALGGQEHFYLETHAAWAEPGEDGQTVLVHSSTQHPSEVQACVAHVLGVARHLVVVECPRMGGGFGGKETQGNTWAALAALAARVTGRPVRVRLDRDQDMALTGKRHPFLANWRVGFTDDGMIHALEVDVFGNGGWSLDLSAAIADRAMFHLDNGYYLPNVRFSGRTVKTNIVSNTAFRGFGGPQGMVVIEDIVDHVARTLGLSPEVVRERNLYHGEGETNTTHYGQPIGDNRLNRIWAELKMTCGQSAPGSARAPRAGLGAPARVPSSAEDEPCPAGRRPEHAGRVRSPDDALAARRADVAAWNAVHPHRKRGLAMTPVKFGISFTVTHLNQAGAHILVYGDGSVQVNHGGTEMGQGLHTKMLTVAARALGLPPERLRVMFTRTDQVPNTSATAASSGSDLNGAAVADACRKLRLRLEPVARELLHRLATAEPTTDPADNEAALAWGAAGQVGSPDADGEPEPAVLIPGLGNGTHPANANGQPPTSASPPGMSCSYAGAAAGSAPNGNGTHPAANEPAPLCFADGAVFDPARPARYVTWEEVIAQAYLQRISLAATGFYATPGIAYDRVAGRGRPFFYYASGAAVAEVEVDGFTGMHSVRRVDILHDVGESLNPGVDRGQVEGGFVQGVGWLTCEELIWDERGHLLTHAPSTYKIPAFSDRPADFRVNFLTDAAQPNVIGGSKAVGEPPLMLAISVREALRDAVAAFGPENGGPVELPAPATGEAIFLAVQAQLTATGGHGSNGGVRQTPTNGVANPETRAIAAP